MIKATERMKVRCRLEQVGCSCHGEWLVSARRAVADDEKGLQFQMIMRWASGWKEVLFDTFKLDSEDFPWNVEEAHINVDSEVLDSKICVDIKDQLVRAMKKKLSEQRIVMNDDLSVIE